MAPLRPASCWAARFCSDGRMVSATESVVVVGLKICDSVVAGTV